MDYILLFSGEDSNNTNGLVKLKVNNYQRSSMMKVLSQY